MVALKEATCLFLTLCVVKGAVVAFYLSDALWKQITSLGCTHCQMSETYLWLELNCCEVSEDADSNANFCQPGVHLL